MSSVMTQAGVEEVISVEGFRERCFQMFDERFSLPASSTAFSFILKLLFCLCLIL